jgi:CDP-diacylglycerol--serine O-phosphatidyltransferase
MKRVGVLPTLVTAANGYCGLLAIFKTYDGMFSTAAFLILLAMVFDVLDGKVARISGSTSQFGVYLDSLSDAVSFGVAPAFLAKACVEQAWPGLYPPKLLTLLTAIFALFALLRLARYNVEHASGEGLDREGKEVRVFAGLPTPGAAGVIAGLVFLAYDENALLDYRYVVASLPAVCAICGYFMISRVPYVHFGARFLQGRRDFSYLVLVVFILGLVSKFPHECAAGGFVAYAVSGPVLGVVRRFRRSAPSAESGEEVPEPVSRIPDGL